MSHVRFSLVVASLAVLGGCAGVPKQAVRDATTSMGTQVELAQASLRLCREGEAEHCDRVQRNLENIHSNNQSLATLAEGK